MDLQRKNQDLKLKVEMMSEAALNGNGDDLNNYDRYFILSNADWSLRSSSIKCVFKVKFSSALEKQLLCSYLAITEFP